MLEIPEAARISRQISEVMAGSVIREASVGASAHKFAWFNMEAGIMESLLEGRKILGAAPAAGMVAIKLDGWELVLCDGVCPRFHFAGQRHPEKHLLLLHVPAARDEVKKGLH